MRRRHIPGVLAAALATLFLAAAGHGQPAAGGEPRAAQAERELGESRQAVVEAEREVAESAREAAVAGRELRDNQRELERLRRELDRGRRQMEAAARQISRLGTAGPDAVFVGARGASGRAGIGANIRDTGEGALVIGVTPGGPAAEAGILSGDVITAIDGNPTSGTDRSPSDVVVAVLAATEPGTVVGIEVLRAGEAMSFSVPTQPSSRFVRFLRGLPGGAEFDWVMPDLSDIDLSAVHDVARDVSSYLDLSDLFASRWRDMELVTLSGDLGSYFGTDSGLLVVRSPESGDLDLRDGDVILTIGGRTPTSPEHAMSILASYVPGERLELGIMRRQQRERIEYTIPDPAATREREDDSR